MSHAKNHRCILLLQVSIALKDVNDEAPVFTSPNVTFVTENSPVNTVLLAVKAVDRDEGRNSYVEYILNNEKSTFTLGPVDGLLRLTGPIDREIRQNYTLKVRTFMLFSFLYDLKYYAMA